MFVVLLCCPLPNRPLQLPCTIAPLKAFFLWKKGDRKSEDNNNKKKGKNREEKIQPYTATQNHIESLFQTHTSGHDSCFFSLSAALLCSLAFLFLGLIRLYEEMEVIGEDSWASDESVCAVIALIKRVRLLAARKKKELDNEKAWGSICTDGLVFVKKTAFAERGFCKLRWFLICVKWLVF